MFVRRSSQKTHDKSRKDSQQKQSSIVRQAITAKDSRQKQQGFEAKAIVGCLSSDHRERLTTEAARIRSKSNRQLFVRRSPQKTHDRSRKDSQQKQSSIVRHAITAKGRKDSQQMQSSIVRQAITAKDSRQKPQGFAAKAIVNCSSGDHCKRLTTEAARIRSKSNRWLFVKRSPQKTHDRSRKDSQQKQSSIVRNAITAKAARIRSKSNRWLFVKRSPQKTHDRSRKDSQQKQSSIVRNAITAKAARIRSKSNCQLFVRRSPQKTHDRSRKDSQQKQSLAVRQAITAKDSRQKSQEFAAKAIVIARS